MTLALSSPQWATLETAYGSAEGIPPLLNELEAENADAVGKLFGAICHQSTLYSASIAALPHLVRIANTHASATAFRADVLILAGAICESPNLSDELAKSEYAPAFIAILPEAEELAMDLLPQMDDKFNSTYMLCSIASFAGMPTVARVLDGFSSEEFVLECPACEIELYVWLDDQAMFVAAEDPVRNKAAKRIDVQPGPTGESAFEKEFAWLDERMAKSPAIVDFHRLLPYLFGEACCPACGQSFELFDELMERAF